MYILPYLLRALEWTGQYPRIVENEKTNYGEEASLPLVFWHGMGDSYNSSAMQRVESLAREVFPEVFIHSVWMDEDDGKDQQASLIGNLTADILTACNQLRTIPELSGGFNAVGFSQGGLFLRGAMEVCEDLPMRTLITFGSPHNGVKNLPPCKTGDFICKSKNEVLKRQIWRDSVQESVIPAQYFRDPYNWDAYLSHSRFIVKVNNDGAVNKTYADNLARLERFVMVLFEKDDMVDPKESSWFFDVDRETGETLKFEETESYREDRIGLRRLHSEGKVTFLRIDDVHMAIGSEDFKQILSDYTGGLSNFGIGSEEV